MVVSSIKKRVFGDAFLSSLSLLLLRSQQKALCSKVRSARTAGSVCRLQSDESFEEAAAFKRSRLITMHDECTTSTLHSQERGTREVDIRHTKTSPMKTVCVNVQGQREISLFLT